MESKIRILSLTHFQLGVCTFLGMRGKLFKAKYDKCDMGRGEKDFDFMKDLSFE